jgi:hypothetical protein
VNLYVVTELNGIDDLNDGTLIFATKGSERGQVIRDWLSGKPRDTIARDNVVSCGAVSNIVKEWRDGLAISP